MCRVSMVTMAAALACAAPLAAQAADAMRVVRDPATGELRGPTAAEARAFEKAEAQLRAARTGKAPAPQADVRYPDGTVETKLGEDTHLYSVVTSAADGSLTLHCLPADEAQQLVKSGKRPSGAAVQAKAGHAHD